MEVPGGCMSITSFDQDVELFAGRPVRLESTVTTTLPFLLEAGCLCLKIIDSEYEKQ